MKLFTIVTLSVILTTFGWMPSANAETQSESTSVTHTEKEDRDDEQETVSETEVSSTRVSSGNDKESSSAEEGQQAGQAAGEGGVVHERTVITEKQLKEEGGLDDQVAAFIPQAGFLSLGDLEGDDQVRAVGGLTVEGNLLADVKTEAWKPYLGPTVGVFYSHLGRPGANFFGLNSPSGDAGADMVLIPLNIKGGFTWDDRARIAFHAGVNVNYQNSRRDDPETDVFFADRDWSANTNVGLDFEFGLGDDALLLFRPDWTFRSGQDVFTATIGFGLLIS